MRDHSIMIEEMCQNLCLLKKEFARIYDGTSHIQEIIPSEPSDKFPISQDDLKSLHRFAEKNPIYFNSYKQKILDISCVVYEGDINEYWLNSIKHGTSCQPFYPTWILSAYFMATIAKELGFKELIDIGSGDGRIAYCGEILGLSSHGIEIDEVLVKLQKTSCTSNTGCRFLCLISPIVLPMKLANV